ncbi:relaxase family protein [Haliea atlantica]
MIPFGSQRGLGQDLAAHLQNTQDNEYLEVADLRGSVAQDLEGAFAEWELQARTLTKCQKYLYSLSVNPDDRQGQLTRDQYMDYIDRAEERLGLSGQPRAVVFHIKEGREHAHVVWSRIDAAREKAVHMPFDKDKLMMVTREFARDHNLELPAGYYNEGDDERSGQMSLYDKAAERETGLSKADHMEQVTDIWSRSDNARSFVNGLAEKGYILATGRRPYVLVDFYGGQHALPRLIKDKTIRTTDIRAFLEKEYPPGELPSVDEAKKLTYEHRKSLEKDLKNEQAGARLDQLKRHQKARRDETEREAAALRQRQHKERLDLALKHRRERQTLRRQFHAEMKAIRERRHENRPAGLAAFLGRVTGIELVRRKLHKYQDKRRLEAYLAARNRLRDEQRTEREELQRLQEARSLDMGRKLRALDKIERKERKSLETSLKQDIRVQARGGGKQMPSLALDLRPPGRRAVPHKAKNRHISPFADRQRKAEELEAAFGRGVEGTTRRKQVDLEGDFTRAAEGEKGSEGRGASDGPRPAFENKIRRYGSKRRGRDNEHDRGR